MVIYYYFKIQLIYAILYLFYIFCNYLFLRLIHKQKKKDLEKYGKIIE